MNQRPAAQEYAEYYETYVSKVPDGDVLTYLESQFEASANLLGNVPADRETFAYAEGKWSIREVVGHICDAERVFAHRAHWFARGATDPQPSFDQDAWVPASEAATRPLADLLAEWRSVRAATVQLFRGLPESAHMKTGTASGGTFTVRSFAWIIAGHDTHHFRLFQTHYGLD